VFDGYLRGPNQLELTREEVVVTRDDLITPSTGGISRAGFTANIEVCIRYLAAWLDGMGCVPIHHLMEDAATAEISRAQLWQWLHVGGQSLDDGTAIDRVLFDEVLASVSAQLQQLSMPGSTRVAEAAALLSELTHAPELADFLTLPAYERLA